MANLRGVCGKSITALKRKKQIDASICLARYEELQGMQVVLEISRRIAGYWELDTSATDLT